jgi:putative copper export protein
LWLIPLMQTIHIICVALVFSSVVMIEFRILGYIKSGTVAETARRFVPWIFVCVVVMALTGTILIIGEPTRSLPSFEFQMKILFLAIALAFTIVFARSVRRDAAGWTDSSAVAWGHRGLGYIEPELQQFSMDAWCAPKHVFSAHSDNQGADLAADPWASATPAAM